MASPLLLALVAVAVASIDMGSEWLKVAAVHLALGRALITVAINEMSKRKSPALADRNRLACEEAVGIAARHLSKVFARVRDLLAKPLRYVQFVAQSLFLPYDLVPDARGATAVCTNDRVNVLSLINEHAGAALQYGIDKDFSNGSRHVIFYDMGSGSTYAALVNYSAYNAKEFGKAVPVNQFQVKDVRWNSKLGGLEMEMRLVNYFADRINKQLGNGVDIRQFPKAMDKLKKQVKRIK